MLMSNLSLGLRGQPVEWADLTVKSTCTQRYLWDYRPNRFGG